MKLFGCTAIISIIKLFANLANRIRIKNALKIDLNSKRIRTIIEYSVRIRICFDFSSNFVRFEIQIRFAKFAKSSDIEIKAVSL